MGGETSKRRNAETPKRRKVEKSKLKKKEKKKKLGRDSPGGWDREGILGPAIQRESSLGGEAIVGCFGQAVGRGELIGAIEEARGLLALK